MELESRKPGLNPFKQQNIKAYQPILTPRLVIAVYLVIGFIFLPLGIAFTVSSNRVVEIVSGDYAQNHATGVSLQVNFTDVDMSPPIFLYYQMTNFYQNHRRYLKSRCDQQLRGTIVDSSTACPDCEPYLKSKSKSNETSSSYYYPCGLIARSVFNDTFELFYANNTPVRLQKNGIAWTTDLEYKFNNPPANLTRENLVRTIPDQKDEDFIVWMRSAAFPTFRKLYRIINQPLKGDFRVIIHNNFPVTQFGGKKFVVLSTTSWLGGKNLFLGVSYLVVGGVCILLAIGFAIKNLVKPRLMGDVQYLEWNS